VKHNVGMLDRGIRILVGLALLAVFFMADGPARWIGLIGIVPLGTAAMGWCPLYAVFGLSTCPAGQHS